MTGQGPPPPSLPPSSPPLPAWLQPVIQITTQLGVPTVFAGVLLWFVLTRIGTTLDVIQDNEESRTRIVAAMQDTLVAALDRQTLSFERAMRENIDTNKEIAARMARAGMFPRSQPLPEREKGDTQ